MPGADGGELVLGKQFQSGQVGQRRPALAGSVCADDADAKSIVHWILYGSRLHCITDLRDQVAHNFNS